MPYDYKNGKKVKMQDAKYGQKMLDYSRMPKNSIRAANEKRMAKKSSHNPY